MDPDSLKRVDEQIRRRNGQKNKPWHHVTTTHIGSSMTTTRGGALMHLRTSVPIRTSMPSDTFPAPYPSSQSQASTRCSLGMLDHLHKWLFHFRKTQRSLALHASLPRPHAEKKSYEEVSQLSGKGVKEMSRYFLAVAVQALRSGSTMI